MALTAVHAPAEPSADVDFHSRGACNSWCEQRREQLKRDTEALELTRDELMRTQKETIIQGLCKLNKDVKNMTVGDFNATFGCDVIELIKKQMAAGDVSAKKRGRSVTVATAAGAGDGGGLSLKTPAPHRMGKAPVTAMRTARKGEKITSFSANGSPVEQFDHGELVVTAKKQRGFNGKIGTKSDWQPAFPISIGIGAGNGETIDLSDPNQRKNLDGEQKAQAMQQLMAIQEQMNKLMEDF